MSINADHQFGWPYPKRKDFLQKLNGSGSKKSDYTIKFQGIARTFPVYTVEIDFPKYRLSNGRTQAAQEEYLAVHPELTPDFFQLDFENITAHRIQHDILWKMISRSELYRYFRNPSNVQLEPLILSDSGFVVNGNRRLCAMREFYYGDMVKYSHFSHIDVIVLPNCTERDIDELEANLQIQPDIKEEYTWISKACMLRARQFQHNYTESQLASLYNIKPKDLATTFNQLNIADQYLNTRKKSKQYELIEQNEYAFQQINKNQKFYQDAEKRDLFTQIGFILIDKSDEIEGRLYEKIPDVKENLEKIINKISIDKQKEIERYKTDSVDTTIFGDPIATIKPLVDFVTNQENSNYVVETVIDVIETENEIRKERNKVKAVVNELIEANTHLHNAITYVTDDSSKEGVLENINAIETKLNQLRIWVNSNA